LGYALPDAVRAAVWVLYGIDIMPAAKTEAHDPKELLKNKAATQLVQAAFATLALQLADAGTFATFRTSGHKNCTGGTAKGRPVRATSSRSSINT